MVALVSDLGEWVRAPEFVPAAIAAAATLGGALLVVTRRDVVHAALWLIVTFTAVAVLFVTLAAEFLAMAQILVYAGAIMVLFLFVIILLATGREPTEMRRPGLRGWLGAGLAVGVACVLVLAAGDLAVYREARGPVQWVPQETQTAEPHKPGGGAAAAAILDAELAGTPSIVGEALFAPRNALLVELVTILLLIAMAGAMVIGKGLFRGRDAASEAASEGRRGELGP